MNVKMEEELPVGVYQEGMPWNAVEKVIMERRSIRSFKQEAVPDSVIQRILEAGRFAPSAGNSQPWRFIVIKSREMLEEMEKDAQKVIRFFMFFLDYVNAGFLTRFIRKFYAKTFIRFLPNELHPVPFGLMTQIARGKTKVFHDAPAMILLVEDTRGVSCPAMDIGICGQNMVLAAHSLGLGTCWNGLIKVLMYLPKWRKKFGIRAPYRLEVCIALGTQKPSADGPVPRETQIVEWFDRGLNDPPRFTEQGE